MKKTCTEKVKFVKEDTLIVAVDVWMEMNHGYCTTPDGRYIKPFKFANCSVSKESGQMRDLKSLLIMSSARCAAPAPSPVSWVPCPCLMEKSSEITVCAKDADYASLLVLTRQCLLQWTIYRQL
jgi:hypothetical protein